jgi:predicted nucleic acid-binding protein
MATPTFLLDTGPLSVLCGFPLQGTAYINIVLEYTAILLAQNVAIEVQAAKTGKIARTILPLLKADKIKVAPIVDMPTILDVAYSRDLGAGERGTIKTALDMRLPIVLDDKDAFVIACRFGLHPIGFQDFIVKLAVEFGLSKEVAVEIVTVTARQYPATFLVHTLDILSKD